MLASQSLFPQTVPLPPNPFTQNDDARTTSESDSLHATYNRCLEMERYHLNDAYLVHSRYLGYLITLLPKDGALSVAKEIRLCSNDDDDDEMLKELSEFYIYHLIGLFKANGERTPITRKPKLPGMSNSALGNHRTAKKTALIRDGYRCVVTGIVDSPSCRFLPLQQLQAHNINRAKDYALETNYCHIFSPGIDWDFDINDPNPQKRRWSSSLLEILRSFRIDDLTELMGPKAYSPANGLTFAMDLRQFYDDLDVWLEYLPDHPKANTYEVQHVRPVPSLTIRPSSGPITVTLNSTDPSTLPVPNPKYLQIRATISKIAQLSGVAHRLLLEKYEAGELSHLAPDGSSANILASRLHFLSLMTRR